MKNLLKRLFNSFEGGATMVLIIAMIIFFALWKIGIFDNKKPVRTWELVVFQFGFSYVRLWYGKEKYITMLRQEDVTAVRILDEGKSKWLLEKELEDKQSRIKEIKQYLERSAINNRGREKWRQL